MTTREFVWHICRVALAAILLWWDERVFFFYAFTLLLLVLHQIERLRAIVRTFDVAIESKILAVADAVGVSSADFERMADQELERLSPEQRARLEEDFQRAVGLRRIKVQRS